jgi:hypothetical protein
MMATQLVASQQKTGSLIKNDPGKAYTSRSSHCRTFERDQRERLQGNTNKQQTVGVSVDEMMDSTDILILSYNHLLQH